MEEAVRLLGVIVALLIYVLPLLARLVRRRTPSAAASEEEEWETRRSQPAEPAFSREWQEDEEDDEAQWEEEVSRQRAPAQATFSPDPFAEEAQPRRRSARMPAASAGEARGGMSRAASAVEERWDTSNESPRGTTSVTPDARGEPQVGLPAAAAAEADWRTTAIEQRAQAITDRQLAQRPALSERHGALEAAERRVQAIEARAGRIQERLEFVEQRARRAERFMRERGPATSNEPILTPEQGPPVRHLSSESIVDAWLMRTLLAPRRRTRPRWPPAHT